MGFQLTDRTYTIVWPDGHELAGLEVEVRRDFSVRELLGASSKAENRVQRYKDEFDTSGVPSANMALIEKLRIVGFVEDRLVAWNLLDDKGIPVPATLDGALGYKSREVIAAIINESHRTQPPAIPGIVEWERAREEGEEGEGLVPAPFETPSSDMQPE